MARKLTVVISQGQSANPAKRGLEENLVAALLGERGIEVTVVPHLYDLTPEGTGMLCLRGITGDMVVLSWLYSRAAHWTLARFDIRGRQGTTLLKGPEADEDEDAEAEEAAEPGKGIGQGEIPNRAIYHLDLRAAESVEPYVAEIRRIQAENSVEMVPLMGWLSGAPKPESLQRYLAEPAQPAPNPPVEVKTPESLPITQVTRVEENTGRRWYPVIDYSRCTNCLECLDFCLFGVYGVDKVDTILVDQPDNCKKGCPACSRVCPENAIIFPQHKTPAIAGSPGDGAGGGLRIDLSQLFGAPSALEVAAMERDRELVADGRDAVGLTVGIPKRQADKPKAERDDLDDLVDSLDELEL